MALTKAQKAHQTGVVSRFGGNSYKQALINRNANLEHKAKLQAKYGLPTYGENLAARNANVARRDALVKRFGASSYEQAVSLRQSHLAKQAQPSPSNTGHGFRLTANPDTVADLSAAEVDRRGSLEPQTQRRKVPDRQLVSFRR